MVSNLGGGVAWRSCYGGDSQKRTPRSYHGNRPCLLLMELGLKGRRVAISSAQTLHWSSGRDVGLRGAWAFSVISPQWPDAVQACRVSRQQPSCTRLYMQEVEPPGKPKVKEAGSQHWVTLDPPIAPYPSNTGAQTQRCFNVVSGNPSRLCQ